MGQTGRKKNKYFVVVLSCLLQQFIFASHSVSYSLDVIFLNGSDSLSAERKPGAKFGNVIRKDMEPGRF